MMHLNVIYFSITVHPALSYAVEKVKSMLEAANVLKSSGKELLALVPKDSKFGDVSNKIQNAIYWVNASLKFLCPFNGHAAEVPVSDCDIPQFGNLVLSSSSSRSNNSRSQLPPSAQSTVFLLLQLVVLNKKQHMF